ncbi:hypothetical protein K502DRAFT_326006 [Neoconidiobolus thromboides FSU 785]|nr:hypothetical protein K502DRAFT_326006 [Neoconidiobolus thromboides FSU 785]
MNNTNLEIIQKVEILVQDYMKKYDPSHDWLHVTRVRQIALNLAVEYPNLDLELIELGSLLHDISDAKYVSKENAIDIESVLISFGLDSNKAIKVANLVSCVGYRKELQYQSSGIRDDFRETCIELHCVQDADKLDAIGAIGILRCAAFSGAKDIPLYDQSKDQIYKSIEFEKEVEVTGTAISHFYDKLLKLRNGMRTKKGIKLAEKRHNTMLSFLECLHQEQCEVEMGN